MNIQSAKSMTRSAPAVLPDELIIEVFSFLPVKSILRFRCVSKYWKTLISEPSFVKLHLNRSATRNPLFTLITRHVTYILDERTDDDDNDDDDDDDDYDDDGELEMEDCSVIPYSLNCLIQNPSFTLSVDPYYRLSDKNCYRMVSTCNGLILLTGVLPDLGFFRLWNPATKETSPNFGYFRRSENLPEYTLPFLDYYIFSFGCDNSTGTYKIVASPDEISNVIILSYGDNVWREIQSFPAVPLCFYYNDDEPDGVYLSSTLNWLAIHNKFDYDDINNLRVEQFVIVSLHLGTETFSQYRLPRGIDQVPIVGVLGGFLCCSYSYKETDFIIWQMKELGVEESWTQFLKISYQNLQIDYDHVQLVPMLLSEDADTLLLKSNQEYHPILYNWRENRVERTKITTSSTINDNRTRNPILLGCSTKVYVESLVSIF